MSSVRWSFVAGLFAAVTLAGCNCSDNPNTIPVEQDGGMCGIGSRTCATDDDCPERNVCHKDRTTGIACCQRSFRKCADDSQCCPGQTCTDSRCIDSFDECSSNADCGETPDHVCKEWTDPMLGKSMRCTFEPCGANGACPEGQACFAHFCVVNPPCGGSCPSGTACVPQAKGGGRCHPYGTRCDLKPKPGYLVVFTKPDNVFDICAMADVACEYQELPPLPSLDLGRHASGAVAADKIEVAMYDGFYGDLVVSEYDLAGKKLKSSWVDGVPASGTLTGGPNGPRGGIAEPGPNVGKYTSTAAKADGTVYVAYYDQTNGDLRFAERTPAGTWSSHKVDGTAADVGLYASLVVDPGGKPAIAYFMRAGTEDPTVSCALEPGAPKALLTGVKLARSRVEHPKSDADWAVEMVDCASRPPPPCWGCEAGGAKVCVEDAIAVSKTACKDAATGCAPACATSELCVAGNTCLPKGNKIELADVPWGKGLFPSLAFKGTSPVVAYYDRNKGNLVAAQQTGTTWDRKLLDGEDATGDTGNVGLFPSLAIEGSGNYAIAYHDFTRRGLRIYSGATLVPLANQKNPPASNFVDKGISDAKLDGPAWVGADASLIFTSAGLYVGYQNSTAGDLRLAHLSGGSWKVSKEWTPGSLGFFAGVLPLSDGLLVLHTKIHAKIAGGKAVPDNELKLEFVRPAPP